MILEYLFDSREILSTGKLMRILLFVHTLLNFFVGIGFLVKTLKQMTKFAKNMENRWLVEYENFHYAECKAAEKNFDRALQYLNHKSSKEESKHHNMTSVVENFKQFYCPNFRKDETYQARRWNYEIIQESSNSDEPLWPNYVTKMNEMGRIKKSQPLSCKESISHIFNPHKI